jgi:hypothetical protein
LNQKLCYTGLVKIMEWAVYFRKYDRYDKISFTFIRFLYILYYTGILRVIMSPIELKMQPTIHLQR